MTQLSVLMDETRTVSADLEDGRATIESGRLEAATGWELKPEGLCRGDVCVPVRDHRGLVDGDRLDLSAFAGALDRPIVIDTDATAAAIGEPRAARRGSLDDLRAAPFTLPDVHGVDRSLSEWAGNKKLLVAFASW